MRPYLAERKYGGVCRICSWREFMVIHHWPIDEAHTYEPLVQGAS